MSALSFKYSIHICLLVSSFSLFNCSSSKKSTSQSEYFEYFENHEVKQAYYYHYYILEGNKRVFRLHTSTHEIVIETLKKGDNLSFSDLDFEAHKCLILKHKEDAYRIFSGKISLEMKGEEMLEYAIDIRAHSNVWEENRDIEDRNVFSIKDEGKLAIKATEVQ